MAGGSHLEPTPAQGEAFAAAAGGDEPVFMLNLLRFKDVADGVDAAEEISGMEAYARYAEATASHLERVGGHVVWAGSCDDALIGPAEREWDVAAVVRYPSRPAFLQMISDPGYLEIAQHRSAGLADSRLVPCAGVSLGARPR
jgi:uncharacterized protein (DUF1330 family)